MKKNRVAFVPEKSRIYMNTQNSKADLVVFVPIPLKQFVSRTN